MNGRTWIVALLLMAPARAHDLWLIAPEGSGAGSSSSIRVHSGTEFPISEHAPNVASFLERKLIDPAGMSLELSPAPAEGNSGRLEFRPGGAGIYVAAVVTTPKLITLPADEFNSYLISDGMPHIYRMRAEEGSLDEPGRERYQKSPKVLIRVGDGRRGDPCRTLGLPLELVPLSDPFACRIGEALRVRVLFRDEPLAGARLGWDRPGDGPEPSGSVRADEKGEALVPIARSGLMTIRLTHMTRPRRPEYEWQSAWTTLTWAVPE